MSIITPEKLWTVIRHSGRSGYAPRTACHCPEDRATRMYEAISKDLKQGSVLLLDHNGGLQRYLWAPKPARRL